MSRLVVQSEVGRLVGEFECGKATDSLGRGSGLSSRTGDEMTADPVMRRKTNTAGGVARPPLPRIRGLVTAAPAANRTKTGGRLVMLEKVLRSASQQNPTLIRKCIASCAP